MAKKKFQYHAVLSKDRPVRFNIKKSKITGSLDIKGELDDEQEPMRFGGVIFAPAKRGSGWGIHLFHYLNSANATSSVIGDGAFAVELRNVVLKAYLSGKRKSGRR